MSTKIYIDALTGNDSQGDGSSSKPYKTLEYFCNNIAVKTDGDYTVYLKKGTYELTKNDIFGQFSSGNLTIIGLGEQTEILQKTGMYINTVGGSANFTLNITKCRYNILTTLTSNNLIGFNWAWNFYNVLFEYTPNNSYSVFSSSTSMTIRNCVKFTNTTSFLRKNSSTISVYDSMGYFTSGYSTSQSDWDKGGNSIGSVVDYVKVLKEGLYKWNTNKTLILHDGEYKKFFPKLLGKDSTINAVPNMTSDTSPKGKVTARGAYNPAWQAFDRNSSTYWYDNGSSENNPSWLQYEFDSPKIINKIALDSLIITGSSYGLKEFTLLGSNNGLNYDSLLSVNNHPNGNAKVTYHFNNNNEYLFYKLQFGLSYYNYYALVSSFEMYEMATTDTPAYWSTVSHTLPNSTHFLNKGMDNLSPLFNRTVTELEPLPMTQRNDILSSEEVGKVFSETLNLKKYFDIRSIRIEAR